MAEKKYIKNFCSRCQFDTNHLILFLKTVNNEDEDYHCAWKYMAVQCLGCESVSYRTDFEDYEVSYPDEYDNWHHDITTDRYPNSLKNYKSLSNTWILPEKIKIVYNEAINAFKSNCFLLTGVAFRAVIEAVCIDKEIKGRNLELKINNLSKARLITEKEAERLHSIRFIGNDSVHEMTVPKEKTLYIVLEIIEHLLKNIYIIDYQLKDNLETLINEYPDFIKLLNKELKNFNKGDEYPLAKYFGRDMRRLNGKISLFENELITKINSGDYKKLKLGKIGKFASSKDDLQHFIIE